MANDPKSHGTVTQTWRADASHRRHFTVTLTVDGTNLTHTEIAELTPVVEAIESYVARTLAPVVGEGNDAR